MDLILIIPFAYNNSPLLSCPYNNRPLISSTVQIQLLFYSDKLLPFQEGFLMTHQLNHTSAKKYLNLYSPKENPIPNFIYSLSSNDTHKIRFSLLLILRSLNIFVPMQLICETKFEFMSF